MKRPYRPGFVDVNDGYDVESNMSAEEFRQSRLSGLKHVIPEDPGTRYNRLIAKLAAIKAVIREEETFEHEGIEVASDRLASMLRKLSDICRTVSFYENIDNQLAELEGTD